MCIYQRVGATCGTSYFVLPGTSPAKSPAEAPAAAAPAGVLSHPKQCEHISGCEMGGSHTGWFTVYNGKCYSTG